MAQSIWPTPNHDSTQLIRPKSRPNSWLKMTTTATTLVTLGTSSETRKRVWKRSRLFSRCASQMASTSCGAVDRMPIDRVLKVAFQK
ncbi:hypothetical protein ACFSTC_47040 [Nonomuraea ferruginea]